MSTRDTSGDRAGPSRSYRPSSSYGEVPRGGRRIASAVAHIHYGTGGTRVLLRLAVPDGVLDGAR